MQLSAETAFVTDCVLGSAILMKQCNIRQCEQACKIKTKTTTKTITTTTTTTNAEKDRNGVTEQQ
jgi:hypothetical protein